MHRRFSSPVWTNVVVAIAAFGALHPSVHAQSDAAGNEFFEKKIRPLLVKHCYSCHSAGAAKISGKLLLDSRDAVLKGGRSGPALTPGKPGESLLLKAVRYDKDLRMPPKYKLAATEIADLETWIKRGAPDPRIGAAVAIKKAKSIDIEQGKKHWSLQPVKTVVPPTVKDPTWSSNPIDPFILTKLTEKGLKPAALAERGVLLRRITYDLTGLPPRPEELHAFANDQSPDAYAKVVERLLASPAYGERWGRHWLDVVRYADTAGDNSDYPIPQMYRYRDWVIRAFNNDMPYDRFISEQLAGDLMPAPSDDDRKDKIIATGYLANSRRHGSYEDARYPWHLTIEDTIDNVSKAFLGMTLGCARCHDHKFDPFSAEDYYALYGFFSSTRYPWPGTELDRAQHDFIPLAQSAEVERALQLRQKKIAEYDVAVKKLEQAKAPKDKIQVAKKEREKFAKQPLPFDLAYAVTDGKNEPKKRTGQVGDVRVQFKGDPDYPGKLVPRRFPLVLGGQTLPPNHKGSGRLELAHWIASPDNPLTARVMVNRIWQGHFGKGIAASANNFGKQGQPPTHPALLDFLAKTFTDNGWSIKKMHRLIVRSRVYQLASTGDDANAKSDPGNEWYGRFPSRRLDAESIRDTLLSVSDGLERGPGGPHPFPAPTAWDFTQHKPFKAVYPSNRRSIYLMTQRMQRHPFLALFDGPDTNASTTVRTTSTTPLQALFLMNDPFVHEQARKFASRLLKECPEESARIERAFLLAFGRAPTGEETKEVRRYLTMVGDRFQKAGVPDAERSIRSWESFARVLFLSNEFVYVN